MSRPATVAELLAVVDYFEVNKEIQSLKTAMSMSTKDMPIGGRVPEWYSSAFARLEQLEGRKKAGLAVVKKLREEVGQLWMIPPQIGLWE